MTRTEYEIAAMQIWGWPGWFAAVFVDEMLRDRSVAPKDVFWKVLMQAWERDDDRVYFVMCPEGW